MAFAAPPAYHYRPWSVTEGNKDSRWQHDALVDRRFSAFSMSRHSPVQPMARYLQEPDRALFTSGNFDEDPAMHPFPSVPANALRYVDSDGSLYSLPQRLPSPSNSGLSSSHISSSWSDRERTPWSPPEMSVDAHMPDTVYIDHAFYNLGAHGCHGGTKGNVVGHCVALHEVQQYADAQPEKVAFDDEHAGYGSYPQEGYQPMDVAEEVEHKTPVVPSQRDVVEAPNGHHGEEAAPVLRRRRAQSNRTVTSPYLPSKVSKRPGVGKRTSSSQSKTTTDADAEPCVNGGRASFVCPFYKYGCQSTFGSKNEWKRHVNTQHMRLGYWRCDQCPQGERKPNDFNRKDLFIQHVRRMHPVQIDTKSSKNKAASARANKNDAEEQALVDTSKRCYRKLRSPPERSGCLFCDASFEGATTWEERMEHVGRHMEAAKKDTEEAVDPDDWRVDAATEEWLTAERIVVARGRGKLVLADMK
ncbi:hypothetical protein LTR85_008446 [Meristemomyces frigidus]|nr:hypothetical protein LTR85_008446 [Meristemomyces frigidus]